MALPPAIAAEQAPAPPEPGLVRAVKTGGPLSDELVARHVEFARKAGFNGLWIEGRDAGQWLGVASPALDPAFTAKAKELSAQGVRVLVVVQPLAASSGEFLFSRGSDRKRLRKFVRLLRRQADVSDVVLSFHGAPTKLSDLHDLLEQGLIAAAAHVDLAAYLARDLDETWRLWLRPTIASDLHLEDLRVRYSGELLEALERLDRRVGIVWNGPAPLAQSVTAADLRRARERLGNRELILEDRFPYHGLDDRLSLALVLAPLKNRDPAIAGEIAVYVACPMADLAASRLSLLTVADFLRDPGSYESEASWQRAIVALAGPDVNVQKTLQTQALEWGGFIGERNYRTVRTESPREVAARLRDPAYVASWKWTVTRYPGRIETLAAIADAEFGNELLEVMQRRLAVARAVRPARELRARRRAEREDLEALVVLLRRERELAATEPTAATALDRFLSAAGVLDLVLAPSKDDQR